MKNLLAAAIIIFSSTGIFAQTPGTDTKPAFQKFKGGIMINPLLVWGNANVDDPTQNSVESKGLTLGFAYGLIGEYFFNNNYGLSMNLRTSSFKTEFNYTPVNGQNLSIDRKINLQYIELPFCLKMRTNEVGYMKYFAQIGLEPAVKIGANLVADTLHNGVITGTKTLNNVTENVNLFMLYSVIGVGVEYNLGGTTNLVGSITWNNGFTNVWDKAIDSPKAIPPVYSNFNSPVSNISLNIGVLF
jgi:hypothetical protein